MAWPPASSRIRAGQLGRLAEADRDDPRQAGAGREDRAGLALGPLELGDFECAGDRAAGRLIGLLP